MGPRLSGSSRQTVADLSSSRCYCRLVPSPSPPGVSPVTSGRASSCNPSPQCLPGHGLFSGKTEGMNQGDTRAERSFALPVIHVFEALRRAKRGRVPSVLLDPVELARTAGTAVCPGGDVARRRNCLFLHPVSRSRVGAGPDDILDARSACPSELESAGGFHDNQAHPERRARLEQFLNVPGAQRPVVNADIVNGPVGEDAAAFEPLSLDSPRLVDPSADLGGGFAGVVRGQFLVTQGGDLDMDVISVEERAGDARGVALDLGWRAAVFPAGIRKVAARTPLRCLSASWLSVNNSEKMQQTHPHGSCQR
jgi:hypothetical protein